MKVLKENLEVNKEKTKVTLTHEKMNELFEIFETMELCPLGYYPTPEEIAVIESDIPKYYAFVIWLLSNPEVPQTRDEIESEKELNRIIMTHTKFKKSSR